MPLVVKPKRRNLVGYFYHLLYRQENKQVLPKADVPTDHGNGVVPAVHCHGEIECSDNSNQAYGIPLLDERMAGP